MNDMPRSFDREITLADARAMTRSKHPTRHELEGAAAILAFSALVEDRELARHTRHALNAQPGAELSAEARDIFDRLHAPRNDLCRKLSAQHTPRCMAHHFAALKPDQKRAKPGTKIMIGVALFIFAFVASLFVQTAWAKTERTLLIFQQIEDLNHE